MKFKPNAPFCSHATAAPACALATLVCTLALHTALATPELPAIPANCCVITSFGARGDGTSTNTSAIQAAINAAARNGGGVVQVPKGVFLSGPLQLTNSIELRLEAGAVLRMLPLDQYPGGVTNPASFLGGKGLHDLAITGAGTIDGQGAAWWPYARRHGARRPRMIGFSSCQRVLIEHVLLTNAPMFFIAISGPSEDVTVRGVTIRAPASTDRFTPSHNTDACDVTARHVLIEGCDVSVGDDNFTCAGGACDVLITNCTYGYGHGVSIGSPTAGGVSNFTVVDCTFNNTDQGIRIKTDRDRGGYLHNLSYQNLRMTNVGFPILIYCSYMATNRQYRALNTLTPAIAATYPAATVTAKTPVYRTITFSNITATAQTGFRAGLIWGLPEMPVTNVLMYKVNITADKPFGIYEAQGVRLVDCKITTPAGINKLSCTNAQVSISSTRPKS